MPTLKPPSVPYKWKQEYPRKTRVQKIFETSGTGRKQCPSCNKYIGAPSKICINCGYKFIRVTNAVSTDKKRVLDTLARKQDLINRITEITERRDVEDIISNIEFKLKIAQNEKEEDNIQNFEIISISNSIIDRPFNKLINLSVDLSWKFNESSIQNIFSERIFLFLKLKRGIKFILNKRILKINISLLKPKEDMAKNIDSEEDIKYEIDREIKILRHLLCENYLVSNPNDLSKKIENAYKDNEFKKIKSIGWNWNETDEEFIRTHCIINQVVDSHDLNMAAQNQICNTYDSCNE